MLSTEWVLGKVLERFWRGSKLFWEWFWSNLGVQVHSKSIQNWTWTASWHQSEDQVWFLPLLVRQSCGFGSPKAPQVEPNPPQWVPKWVPNGSQIKEKLVPKLMKSELEKPDNLQNCKKIVFWGFHVLVAFLIKFGVHTGASDQWSIFFKSSIHWWRGKQDL